MPLSVLVLDCDDFKDVNDRAGHEFGDALLKEVAVALEQSLPEGAEVARLGGDEFVVMLRGAGAATAEELGERIRSVLADGLTEAGFPLRLSGGIATYPFDGATPTALLRAADQALYVAKDAGKDRIASFRDVVTREETEPGFGGGRPRGGPAPGAAAGRLRALGRARLGACDRERGDGRGRARPALQGPRLRRRRDRLPGIARRRRLPRRRGAPLAPRDLPRPRGCLPHLGLSAHRGDAAARRAAHRLVPREGGRPRRGVHPARARHERAADAPCTHQGPLVGPRRALRDENCGGSPTTTSRSRSSSSRRPSAAWRRSRRRPGRASARRSTSFRPDARTTRVRPAPGRRRSSGRPGAGRGRGA